MVGLFFNSNTNCMKIFCFVLIPVFSFNFSYSQELNGAWKKIYKDSVNQNTIKLFSNSYFTSATYLKSSGEFISASGGTYSVSETDYIENYEIDSDARAVTGTYLNYDYNLKNDTLRLNDKNSRNKETWVRIDTADKAGVTCWKIHQAYRNSEWVTIEDKPRKTLKMLTDNYYQVLALNSQTGEFFGSSGGKWKYEDEKHHEMILFFSKNPNMANKILSFDKEVEHDIWLHKGKSSKGDYIKEKWKKFK